jgi:hypothetical protein
MLLSMCDCIYFSKIWCNSSADDSIIVDDTGRRPVNRTQKLNSTQSCNKYSGNSVICTDINSNSQEGRGKVVPVLN